MTEICDGVIEKCKTGAEGGFGTGLHKRESVG
jgi:hypothetical protein